MHSTTYEEFFAIPGLTTDDTKEVAESLTLPFLSGKFRDAVKAAYYAGSLSNSSSLTINAISAIIRAFA